MDEVIFSSPLCTTSKIKFLNSTKAGDVKGPVCVLPQALHRLLFHRILLLLLLHLRVELAIAANCST